MGDLGCLSNSGLIPDRTPKSGDLSGPILTTSDLPKKNRDKGARRRDRPRKTEHNNPKIKAFLDRMKKRNVEKLRNVNGMDSGNGGNITPEKDMEH